MRLARDKPERAFFVLPPPYLKPTNRLFWNIYELKRSNH